MLLVAVAAMLEEMMQFEVEVAVATRLRAQRQQRSKEAADAECGKVRTVSGGDFGD
jgi:hypothetical protein